MNDIIKTDATENQEDLTGTAATAEPADPVFCYSLVLAEVIYATDKGVTARRTQIFSKSDGGHFPADRLAQIQNSAAQTVKNEVDEKGFKALEVIVLNIIPLGWMTDEVFWGSRAAIPQADPTQTEPVITTAPTDNVVPMQRP